MASNSTDRALFEGFSSVVDVDALFTSWLQYGVALTLLMVAAALLLCRAHCKASRIMTSCTCAARNLSCWWWSTAAAYLAVAAVILLTLIWGFTVAVTVKPFFVGMGILTLLPAMVLLVYGFGQWADQGWRLGRQVGGDSASDAPVDGNARANLDQGGGSSSKFRRRGLCGGIASCCIGNTAFYEPVVASLILAALLTITFEATLVFSGSPTMAADGSDSFQYQYSYLATSWVFLTVNSLLVVLVAQLATASPDTFSAHSLVASAVQVDPSLVGELEWHEVLKHQRHPSNQVVGGGGSRFGERSRNGLVSSSSARYSLTLAAILYGLSLLVLAAYAVVNYTLADNAADSGKWLGFTTVGTLLLVDVITAFAFLGNLFATPGLVALVVCGTRALVIAFGARYWMLGVAMVYLLYGLYLARITTHRYFLQLVLLQDSFDQTKPSAQTNVEASAAEPAAAAGAGGATTTVVVGGRPPALADAEPEMMVSSRSTASHARSRRSKWCCAPGSCCGSAMEALVPSTSLTAALTAPGVLLIILTAFFAVLVWLFWTIADSVESLPSNLVPMLDQEQPQWTFGAGALVLVCTFLLAGFARGYFEKDGNRFSSREGFAVAVGAVVGMAAFGVMLWVGTSSEFVLAFFAILPSIVAILFGLYGQWVHDDYAIIVPGGFGWCPCMCKPGTLCGEVADPAADEQPSTNPVQSVVATAAGSGAGDGKDDEAASGGAPAAAAAAAGGSASAAGSATGTDDTADPSEVIPQAPSKRCSRGLTPAQLRNTAVVVAAMLLLGLLAALGAVTAVAFEESKDDAFSGEPSDVGGLWGWFLAGECLVVILTVAPLIYYFGTWQLHIGMVAPLAVALILHCVVHALVIVQLGAEEFGGSGNASLMGGVFSMCLYPCLVVALAALYKMRDDGWRGSRWVYVALGVSQLTIVGFLVAGILVFGNLAATLGILVSYLAALTCVGVYVYVKINRGYIPRWMQAGIGAIVLFLFVAGLVLTAWSYTVDDDLASALYYFSISWWLVTLILIVGGLWSTMASGIYKPDPFGLQLGPDSAASSSSSIVRAPLIFSDALFPVFQRSQATGRLVGASAGPAGVIVGGIFAITWGYAAAIFVTPTWAGLIVASLTKVGLLIYCLDASRRSQELFTDACRIINDAHADDESAIRQTAQAVATGAAAAGGGGGGGSGPSTLQPPPPAPPSVQGSSKGGVMSLSGPAAGRKSSALGAMLQQNPIGSAVAVQQLTPALLATIARAITHYRPGSQGDTIAKEDSTASGEGARGATGRIGAVNTRRIAESAARHKATSSFSTDAPQGGGGGGADTAGLLADPAKLVKWRERELWMEMPEMPPLASVFIAASLEVRAGELEAAIHELMRATGPHKVACQCLNAAGAGCKKLGAKKGKGGGDQAAEPEQGAADGGDDDGGAGDAAGDEEAGAAAAAAPGGAAGGASLAGRADSNEEFGADDTPEGPPPPTGAGAPRQSMEPRDLVQAARSQGDWVDPQPLPEAVCIPHPMAAARVRRFCLEALDRAVVSLELRTKHADTIGHDQEADGSAGGIGKAVVDLINPMRVLNPTKPQGGGNRRASANAVVPMTAAAAGGGGGSAAAGGADGVTAEEADGAALTLTKQQPAKAAVPDTCAAGWKCPGRSASPLAVSSLRRILEGLQQQERSRDDGAPVPTLLWGLHKALAAVDAQWASAHASEQRLMAGVHAAVIAAGVQTAIDQREQWQGFLRWAASPDATQYVRGLRLGSVVAMYRAARSEPGCTVPRGLSSEALQRALGSQPALSGFWERTLGPVEADKLTRRLGRLRVRHAQHVAAEEAEDMRKRLEELEGERKRREILRQQAEAERRRKAADMARRVRERQAALEAREEEQAEARERAERQRIAAEQARIAEAERRHREQAAAAAAAAAEMEAARRRAAEEAEAARRRQAAEAARIAAEAEEALRLAQAEADHERRRAAEEAARQRRAEQERRAAEEAQRAAAERAAAEEAARQRQLEQQRRAEEARRHAEAARREAEEARQRQAEAERARQAALRAEAEAAARREAEEEARREAAAAAGGGGEKQFFEEQERSAMAKISSIREAVRAGGRGGHAAAAGGWVDPEFDGGEAVYGPGTRSGDKDQYMMAGGWQRFPERVGNAALVTDDFSAQDLVQGVVGDCWFVAAVAVVANRPDLVRRLFITTQTCAEGVYAVRMCLNRRWTVVYVDDRFPWWDPGKWGSGGETNEGPLFLRSADRREMWPSLLEKAYAKHYRSWMALDGGQSHNALADLTGGIADKWTIKSKKADIASGQMWREVKQLLGHGHLLAAGSHSGSDTDTNENGIVLGHAFSILDAQDVRNGQGQDLQMIKVRNPHGRTEWKGKYSDEDVRSWDTRLRTALNHDPSRSGDDGTWWMQFSDFVQNFRNVYICRLFDSDKWHSYSAEGAWVDGESAGGCPNNDSVVQNEMFYIQPTKPCTVFISLRVLEDPGAARTYKVYVGMKLYQKQGRKIRYCYENEERCETASFTNAREVSMEAELQPESHPLTLLPCTFNPGKEARYVISVHSTEPLANVEAAGAGGAAMLRKVPESAGHA